LGLVSYPRRIQVHYHQLLVQRADDLVDPRARPQVEEGRALQGNELPRAALLRLCLGLAGSRRLLVSRGRGPESVIAVRLIAVVLALLLQWLPASSDAQPKKIEGAC